MQSSFSGDFYDADYFERGQESKKGWLQNYRWMPRRSYREAFAFIDALELDETSKVLDFGCAKGFIVRALQGLDIDAEGCDISEYALSFAPKQCILLDDKNPLSSLSGRYTHIICKDVFEHLTPQQLTDTLQQLTKVAPKMMCVIPMGDNGVYRIPEYHLEVSHLIAEDELWWCNAFDDSGWKVTGYYAHLPGLKDNWAGRINGNRVFILEVA